jgi:hypothetical protein
MCGRDAPLTSGLHRLGGLWAVSPRRQALNGRAKSYACLAGLSCCAGYKEVTSTRFCPGK